MTWILPKQLHTLASALDTEALSLDSNEQSQVCAQSVFVRSKPSQLRIWSAKWKRDSWTQHLSGRILRPFLGQRFATEWTSSLGATHVSPSVQPANAGARTTQGTSGPTSQTVFDFSGLGAASLKTSKDISAWGCPTSSKTWQEWVIERRGAYSARLNAERHTRESGCSSWPTSSARDWKGCYTTLQRKDGKMRGDLLPDAVNLEEKHGHPAPGNWPTPSGMDGERPQETQEQWEQRNARKKSANPNLGQLHRPLTVAVTAMHGPPVPASSSTDGSRPGLWHTPTQAPEAPNTNSRRAVREGRQPKGQQHSLLAQAQWQTATVSTGAHRQKDGSMTDKLDQQVKSWATPRAGKTTDENPETWALRQAKGDVATMPLTAQVKSWATPRTKDAEGWMMNQARLAAGKPEDTLTGQTTQSNKSNGKLNPRWVETLMGLPVGWTMPSCVSPVTIERMNSDSSVTVLSRQQQNEPSEH